MDLSFLGPRFWPAEWQGSCTLRGLSRNIKSVFCLKQKNLIQPSGITDCRKKNTSKFSPGCSSQFLSMMLMPGEAAVPVCHQERRALLAAPPQTHSFYSGYKTSAALNFQAPILELKHALSWHLFCFGTQGITTPLVFKMHMPSGKHAETCTLASLLSDCRRLDLSTQTFLSIFSPPLPYSCLS